jgi:hypothetical protein
MVATIAVAHRTHRLAFAVIRSQKPYDPVTGPYALRHRWPPVTAVQYPGRIALRQTVISRLHCGMSASSA